MEIEKKRDQSEVSMGFVDDIEVKVVDLKTPVNSESKNRPIIDTNND